ncbi:MAG: Uma2 family endonuclease [Cytophagales bacterium]|nr:Uma2 family endonuclease [Cytophagales bacterium]
MKTLTIDNTKEWTVEDYLLLGEMNTPCQLINGELIMSPALHPHHQRVSGKLYKLFDKFLQDSGEVFYAPIDLYIDKRNIFQPDLVYLSNETKKYLTNRGIEGPVDIVVEIISPSNSYTDRNQKKSSYLAFGIKEYWIVDPGNRTVEIYTPQSGGDVPISFISKEGTVQSSLVKNLRFDLKEIF